MNNLFLKRLMKVKSGDVLHSSAYARAQNSGMVGATSVESFDTRINIEQNRKNIRGYGDSRVVNDAFSSASRAKVLPGAKVSGDSGLRTKSSPPARKNPGIFR